MAALVSKRVRTTQPQPGEATLIDWDNPITKDMTVCLMHADQAYGFASYIDGANLPASVNVVPFTGGTQSNTPLGTGGRPTGTAGMYDLTAKGAINSPSYSLFAFGTCTSAGATQSAMDMDNSAGRYFQFRIAGGKVDFIPFNNSASPTGQATSPVALSLSEMSRGFTMGATASPTRTACFQNGVATVGPTPSNMLTPTTTLPIRVGVRQTGTQAWSTGALMLVVVWVRALADSEMQSLADNPWQLFKPKHRRLYMVTAAASSDGSTTLSGVSAASSVGTVAAAGNADGRVTGVQASSAVASITATGGAGATLSGVSAAPTVASVSATGGASTTLTGDQASAGVSTVATTGDANTALTGVSAAPGVGTITASVGGSAMVPLSGVAASSAVASVTASGAASVTLGAVASNGKSNDMVVTGGATVAPAYVSAAAAVGTITASGTTGSATANLQGVAASAAVGTIAAAGTRTAIEVDVTEDMVCRAVRAYIKSIAGGMSVQRTPVNRASMPKGAYVSFTPGLRRPLSTNREVRDDNSRTVSRPEQMSFQIDCYGQGSSELAEMLNVLYRDVYACDLFDSFGFSDAPLYAGDIQQAPYVNGEDQYENRYTFEIELQINSRVTVPLQSCNILGIDLVSVDATFPPTEE